MTAPAAPAGPHGIAPDDAGQVDTTSDNSGPDDSGPVNTTPDESGLLLPGTAFTIAVPGPFDAAVSFRVARFYAVHGVHVGVSQDDAAVSTDDPGIYLRPVSLGTHAGQHTAALFRVTAQPAPALRVEAVAVTGTPTVGAARAAAVRIAQPHADPAPFYHAAALHQPLAETVHALHGLRVLGFESIFSALLATIIEQQITLKGAQTGERWLLARYGIPVAYDGAVYHTFPPPDALAGLVDEALRPLKITFVRINRVLALARRFADGALDEAALAALPPAAVYDAVRAVPGVGHWTAAWALLRARGMFLPVGSADVALRAAVNAYWFGQPGRASREATDAVLESVAPFGGWASFYLLTRWGLEKGY